MDTLETLLGWVVGQLQAWAAVEGYDIQESKSFSEDRFHFKIRAQLSGPYQLQVRFYFNRGHLDYSYQLFTDIPLMRWDNKEDVPLVETAPHHFHAANGEIVESPLNGAPTHDWPIVKDTITKFLEDQNRPKSRFESIEL